MVDFIVSVFAAVLQWLVPNVWLVVYWILIPLAVAYGAYFVVKHSDSLRNLRFVFGGLMFVMMVFMMMAYSGEFGSIF